MTWARLLRNLLRMTPDDLNEFLDQPSDRHWKLDKNGEPVRCKNLREWTTYTDGPDANERFRQRVVARTRVGSCEVSTVFLLLDHSWGDGPPVLWETMIFTDSPNHRLHHNCTRCAGKREQAEAMHAEIVAQVAKLFGVPVPVIPPPAP